MDLTIDPKLAMVAVNSWLWGLGFRVQDLGFRFSGLGLGFRVWGLGLKLCQRKSSAHLHSRPRFFLPIRPCTQKALWEGLQGLLFGFAMVS